jgi:hypothetical protein
MLLIDQVTQSQVNVTDTQSNYFISIISLAASKSSFILDMNNASLNKIQQSYILKNIFLKGIFFSQVI